MIEALIAGISAYAICLAVHKFIRSEPEAMAEPTAVPSQEQSVVRDRHGVPCMVGDRVILHECVGDQPIPGVLVYDRACWAYAVHGDDGKRYLLMDNLRVCIDPGDGGFGWEEIERKLDGNQKPEKEVTNV